MDVIEFLGGPPSRIGASSGPVAPPLVVVDAREDPARMRAYRDLRRRAFVEEQRLFKSRATAPIV